MTSLMISWGMRGEKGGERETLISFLLHAPEPGIQPKTWTCTLTENQTQHLLVHGPTLQPAKPHRPRLLFFFLILTFLFFCSDRVGEREKHRRERDTSSGCHLHDQPGPGTNCNRDMCP
uniref:Fas binding factor 1 n=1 Tax=Molossus molossus TaxID=27622 RepID=A0A7J8CXH5_MOLMO|nr:Fas binding factor 1 [Molossus molossus]